ncbi:unnamed protein product [Phytomonas sp. Hart1]|nr:unnamed protein product [Phytomonas sp. Hart1]|eukprot:CCW69589.1 unnamed protein product [Phytomonas sp. isolate Hart1]
MIRCADCIVHTFLAEEQHIILQALTAHAKFQYRRKRTISKQKKKVEYTNAISKMILGKTITEKPAVKNVVALCAPVGAKLVKR